MSNLKSGKQRRLFTPGSGTPSAKVCQKRVAQEVVRWLLQNGDYPRSADEIIGGVSLPRRTVLRHLSEMVSLGVLERPYQGAYKLKLGSPDITHDPSGRLGLHGIVLKAPNWHETPQGGPVGRVRGWKPYSTYIQALEDFNGRVVRFRFHPRTHTLLIYMEASRKPLELEEFKDFRTWLRTMLYPVDPDVTAYLVQIGINRDYWNWRLDGVKGIRLKKWTNAYVALYQKSKDVVRHEVHLTLREMNLLQAMREIDGGSPTRMLLEGAAKIAEQESKKPEPPKTPEPGYGGYQSGYS